MSRVGGGCERNSLRLGVPGLAVISLTSCDRAPAFNILGSYFPSWMLCMLLAIVLTVGVRLLVRRFGIEDRLEPLVATYPCLTACFAFSMWLLFFS
ncbi:MAG: DUF1656 domain-containing protein [Acidobacteriaceae bacterium]|nr:DUF1656 domain-containing protein [Acidobacteriaceae bacterium]